MRRRKKKVGLRLQEDKLQKRAGKHPQLKEAKLPLEKQRKKSENLLENSKR